MKPITALSALALLALATAPLAAEELSPAAKETKMQLAAHLGVNADDYTLLQLTQLNCRVEAADNDAERERLLSGIGDFGAVPNAPSEMTKAQLANELGVNPDDYEIVELAFLKEMIESDDCAVSDPARWAKSGERVTFETAAAKQQLSAALGVSATEYTLAELVAMRMKIEDDDD